MLRHDYGLGNGFYFFAVVGLVAVLSSRHGGGRRRACRLTSMTTPLAKNTS